MDPSAPRSQQNFSFYVTFQNTTGVNFDDPWNVALYYPNQKDVHNKRTGNNHIVLGNSEVGSAPAQEKVPGGCQPFYAVVVIRLNEFGQIIDKPFPALPGKQNRFDFTVCG